MREYEQAFAHRLHGAQDGPLDERVRADDLNRRGESMPPRAPIASSRRSLLLPHRMVSGALLAHAIAIEYVGRKAIYAALETSDGALRRRTAPSAAAFDCSGERLSSLGGAEKSFWSYGLLGSIGGPQAPDSPGDGTHYCWAAPRGARRRGSAAPAGQSAPIRIARQHCPT